MHRDTQTLRGERGAPPHFARRKAELAHLHKRLNDLCQDVRADGTPAAAKEGIALITGVPGVGKTQLAEKFVEEAGRGERESGREVAHLEIETSSLNNPVGLLLAMGRVLGEKQTARKAAEVESRVREGAAGVGGVLQGRVGYDHARHTGELGDMLRATVEAGMWASKVLVLVIDELQRVGAEGMAALATLHQGGHRCPILVVGAGLQHTKDVLANPGEGVAGISRIERPIVLGNLAPAEAEEAVYEGMAAIGRPITDRQAQRIAEGTFGFPQHINGHLHTAQQVYDEAGGLKDADIARVLELGSSYRNDYYEGRLDAMGEDAVFMASVAAMMEESKRDVLRRSEVARMLDEPTEREQRKRRGAAVVESAIRHGVLTTNFARGTVWFGIPSFQRYLLELHREQEA